MPERQVDRFDLSGRFFEAPRWHGGRWFVSDMEGHAVHSFAGTGPLCTELALDDRPSGLGWMPDGALIVVSMDRRVLWRRPPGAATATVFADLGPLCAGIAGHLNDMAISPAGHAYVGFDPDFNAYGFQSEQGLILRVDQHGASEVAATGLQFPNGMAVSSDGSALFLAETGRPRLTKFAIDATGGLHDPACWATIGAGVDRRVGRAHPVAQGNVGLDGCALDAEGCIWVADANSPGCLRIAPGGDIVDAVFIPENYRCLACALGGEDGRTLLLCGLDLGAGGVLSGSISHLFWCRVETPGP